MSLSWPSFFIGAAVGAVAMMILANWYHSRIWLPGQPKSGRSGRMHP